MVWGQEQVSVAFTYSGAILESTFSYFLKVNSLKSNFFHYLFHTNVLSIYYCVIYYYVTNYP